MRAPAVGRIPVLCSQHGMFQTGVFHMEHIRQLGWSGISLGESIKKQLYGTWGGRNVPVGGQALSVPREHYSILAIPRGSARGEGREILRTGNARNVPRGTFFGGRAGAVWGQIAEVFHVEHFACAQARVGFSL